MTRGPWHWAKKLSISTTTETWAWRRFVYGQDGQIIAEEWM